MDALKGTITRRMDSVLDDLQHEFKILYEKSDFESKLKALKGSGNKSDRPSKLNKLFRMFDVCGIKYEYGKDNAYYENLVRNAEDIPEKIDDKILLALFDRYEDYPSPEDYMKRIVDRLCTEKDGWGNDTLRLRILKQFIKYGNYLADAGYGGRNAICDYVKEKIGKKQKPSDDEVLANVDDGVFNGLDKATKEQRKPDGKYGLLKTADDLASGKFRAEGATKRSLYLFAMVYSMTYYSGDEISIIDYRTDVETNLFRDYYTNNLMRFISDDYRGRLREYELDPSGQGINYKNFAEMIYLYYISKDCSPQDKIRLSSDMIIRVKESNFKQGEIDTRKLGGTSFYKEIFTEDIIGKPDSEFERFICDNYNCETYDSLHKTKLGVLQVEPEQNSAFKEYKNILRSLEKCDVALEKCNYGLWFADVNALMKNGIEDICDRMPAIDKNKFNEFLELLSGINSFIGSVDQQIPKALSVLSSDEVTRTSMIVAYYYYYNAVHENDSIDKLKNFEEVFNNFKRGIDPKLEAAYYQPFSCRNIFDVLVAFSSYAYLKL